MTDGRGNGSSDLAVLACLADPQRRRLFGQVQRAGDPTVAELAQALALGRALVEFHLGKLVEVGLVEGVPAQRRVGVRGRPAQRYRPTDREVVVSVPERRYDVLAGVLLEGVSGHQPGETAQGAALRAARRRGVEIAQQASAGSPRPRSKAARLARLDALLAGLGYAPRADGSTLTVANCPFERFRADHTERVCAVNLEMARGYLDGLDLDGQVGVRLRPCPDACCVVFDTSPS